MTAIESPAAPCCRPWQIVTEPRGGGWWQIVFRVRGREPRALFVPRWFPRDTATAMALEITQVVEEVLSAAAQEEIDG